jgi:hypothetical protein
MLRGLVPCRVLHLLIVLLSLIVLLLLIVLPLSVLLILVHTTQDLDTGNSGRRSGLAAALGEAIGGDGGLGATTVLGEPVGTMGGGGGGQRGRRRPRGYCSSDRV